MNHLQQDEERMSGRAYLTVVDDMRIPMSYLASFLAAGDVQVVRLALVRLVAMRMHMRRRTVGDVDDGMLLQQAGMTGTEVEDMARLLGVAKYEERFVIPTALRDSPALEYEQGVCGLEGLAPPEGLRPLRLRPRSAEKREQPCPETSRDHLRHRLPSRLRLQRISQGHTHVLTSSGERR